MVHAGALSAQILPLRANCTAALFHLARQHGTAGALQTRHNLLHILLGFQSSSTQLEEQHLKGTQAACSSTCLAHQHMPVLGTLETGQGALAGAQGKATADATGAEAWCVVLTLHIAGRGLNANLLQSCLLEVEHTYMSYNGTGGQAPL